VTKNLTLGGVSDRLSLVARGWLDDVLFIYRGVWLARIIRVSLIVIVI
jgi:hypothetical protein